MNRMKTPDFCTEATVVRTQDVEGRILCCGCASCLVAPLHALAGGLFGLNHLSYQRGCKIKRQSRRFPFVKITKYKRSFNGNDYTKA